MRRQGPGIGRPPTTTHVALPSLCSSVAIELVAVFNTRRQGGFNCPQIGAYRRLPHYPFGVKRCREGQLNSQCGAALFCRAECRLRKTKHRRERGKAKPLPEKHRNATTQPHWPGESF